MTRQANDKLAESGERKKRRRRHRKPLWAAATAAVLVIAIAAGVVLRNNADEKNASAGVIAEEAYPEMAPYPDAAKLDINSEEYSRAYESWWEDIRARQMQASEYADGMEPFFSAGIRQFLSGNEGENKVCSPINIYLALSMLAEVTDGESRQQILDLAGADSIETLRTRAKAVWNVHYRNDGDTTSILANSLWLNENIPYEQSALDRLAENYYASAYQGTMGSEKFNRMLQDWLNEQTGGLLEEQIRDVKLNPETILALASTIYYQAQWINEFDKNSTAPDVFRAPSGDVTCDFMHGYGSETYYEGEKFEAVSWGLDNNGDAMWFLLPRDGVMPEELLDDAEAMDFLLNGGSEGKQKNVLADLTLPRIDITSGMDLSEGLKELGVTDIFDGEASDFSPLTAESEGIFVSEVKHDVRIMADEEGVSAAAYTVIMMDGSSADPEEIEITLNRPFLFAVKGRDGLPLFVGCVNQP